MGEAACLGAAMLWAVAIALFRRPIETHGAPVVNFLKCAIATVLLGATVLVADQAAVFADASAWHLTMIAVSPRSVGFVRRFGMNKVIGAGFASISLGFVLLATISPSTSYLIIVVGLVLLSAGMATTIAPATGAIMSILLGSSPLRARYRN